MICGGASIGILGGVFSEASWSECLSFEGTVGGITADSYNANRYGYGLFAYKKTIQDIDEKKYHDFIVVDWWIEK